MIRDAVHPLLPADPVGAFGCYRYTVHSSTKAGGPLTVRINSHPTVTFVRVVNYMAQFFGVLLGIRIFGPDSLKCCYKVPCGKC